MERPPQPPKSPRPPKMSRLAGLLHRRRLLALGLALFTIVGMAFIAASVTYNVRAGADDKTRNVRISQVLTLADQHHLTSVVLRGDVVTATAQDGHIYIATKESGQPLTAYFRDRGASVSVEAQGDGGSHWLQVG